MKSPCLLSVSCLWISLLMLVASSADATNTEGDDFERLTLQRLESVDIDTLLDSPRLVTNFIKCFLQKGPCSPEARVLRDVIPDALKTSCTKCTQKHKNDARKVIKWIVQKKPELWKELLDKYDPSGEYAKKYENEYSALVNS